MFVDFIQNGRGYGEVGETMANCRFDPGLLRPYIDSRGQKCVTMNTGKRDSKGKPIFERRTVGELLANGVSSPVFNALSLRKDEWIQLDTVVLKAARQRLRAWSDLAAANSYGGFNAMAKPILEHETMSDPGEAIVDMDGITEGRADSPLFQLEALPLPITHSSFWYSARQLAASRNDGTPLNVLSAEASARRVAEMVEKTLIGVETGLTYAAASSVNQYGRNATVFGYTNFSARNTKTDLTTPNGTNPEAVMTDVLEMLDLMYADNFYGPFILYHSTDYSRYLSDDYFRSGSTSAVRSLRDRILDIEGIQDVRRLDYLTSGFQLILVQMTSDVAQAINGMDITTIQWESKGGMQLNFKVMAIMVPRLRADYSGKCGIVHGTTS